MKTSRFFLNLLFVAIISMTACTFDGKTSAQTNSVIENVNAATFKTLIASGEGILLDVRTDGEVQRGCIEGATALDMYQPDFMSKLGKIQKDKPVYIYCRSGSRSAQVASVMPQMGFTKVYNLQSGIGDWSRAGYALVTPQKTNTPAATPISDTDFQNAIAANEPVLIKFGTQWCAPCKQMAPIIEKFKQDYTGQASVVDVDPDVNTALAQKYQVESVPTFIVFKNGQEVNRKVGVMTLEQLVQFAGL